MTLDEFPAASIGRPLWLITLADLALLLVGFFVLLQANQHLDERALVDGIRAGFGAAATTPVKNATPVAQSGSIPVAAAAMPDFAPGSSSLPRDPADLLAWARDAARDPRVTFTVTGMADGTSADVDPLTGSPAVLAADRARAVAGIVARVAPGRLLITNAVRPGRRQVTVTLAFDGQGNIR